MTVPFQHDPAVADFDGDLKSDKPAGSGVITQPNPVTGRCYLFFVCPCGCGGVSSVPLRLKDSPEAKAKDREVWDWDGDRDKPTLSPSLQKTEGCRWHGYLKKGVWST